MRNPYTTPLGDIESWVSRRSDRLQPVGGWFSDFFGDVFSFVAQIVPVNLVQSKPGVIVSPGANQSQASYTYADPTIPAVEAHVAQRWFDVHGVAGTTAQLAPVYDMVNAYHDSLGSGVSYGDDRVSSYIDTVAIPWVQQWLGRPDPNYHAAPGAPAALPQYSDPAIPLLEEHVRERYQARFGHWPTDLDLAPVFDKINLYKQSLNLSWGDQSVLDYIDGVALPAYTPHLDTASEIYGFLPASPTVPSPTASIPWGWIAGGAGVLALVGWGLRSRNKTVAR